MKTMHRFLNVLALFVFLFSATSSYADFSLSMYADLKDYKPFQDYILGVGRGIFWANVVMDARGQPRLFCLPRNLALDEGIILSLLDQEIRSSSGDYKADTSIELILIMAFIKRFPCR